MRSAAVVSTGWSMPMRYAGSRSAVAGHDQRILSGVVRPVDDPDEVVEELVVRMAGYGPLQRYLNDPTCARTEADPCS
jgi:hypothetical protein